MRTFVFRPALSLCAILAGLDAAVAQATLQFPDATETTPELIELWKESDSTCGRLPRGDVEVAAACVSRSVYGAAINERGWCLGKDGQDNASMEWHECAADSLRFPPFEAPDF